MYASSGNKHFFTKSCHRQTYQNYEQSRQKLGTILEIKYLKNQKFQKKKINRSWSPSRIFFIEFFFLERFNQFLTQKNDFESTNFEMFQEVDHNFGKSDDDMI